MMASSFIMNVSLRPRFPQPHSFSLRDSSSLHHSLHPIANVFAAVRNCTDGPRRNAAFSMRNYTRVASGASVEKFIPSIYFSDATAQIAAILMNSLCPCASLRSRSDPLPALAAVSARRRSRPESGESRTRATLDAPSKHTQASLHPAFAPPLQFFHHQLCRPSGPPDCQPYRLSRPAFQLKCSSRSQSSAGPAKFPDASPIPSFADARIPAHRKTANPACASISQAPPAIPVSHGNSTIPEHTEIAAAELPTHAQSPPFPETGTPRRRQSRDSPLATPSIAIFSSAPATRSRQTRHPDRRRFGCRPSGLDLPISPAAFPEFHGLRPA